MKCLAVVLAALLLAWPAWGGSILVVRGPEPSGADVTAPTLTDATITGDSTTITLTFDEAVSQGASYADGSWDVDCSTAGSDIGFAYSSGDGTDTWVYTLASTVNTGDTCDIDYATTANGMEDGAGNDLAGITSGPVTVAAGASYADILHYHSFETSATCSSDNADYSAGDNTPTCQSAAAIDTGLAAVGSNSLDLPTSYDRMEFTISSADIADHISGRIGVYVYVTTTAANGGLFRVSYDANNYIQLALFAAGFPSAMRFYYHAGGTDVEFTTSAALSQNTQHFVEARWDQGSAGTDFEVYVDGVSVGSSDGATGTWAGLPTLYTIGDAEGNLGDIHIDQAFSSDDPDRDLNAIKDCTNCTP